MEQIRFAMWNVEALKFMNGGHLLTSPGRKVLARAKPPIKASQGIPRNRIRLLDLGGQATCDWAWQCAVEYRHIKTYTVVTKDQATNPTLRGPFNHRRVSVPHLWKLPFRDGYFDVISARSLFMFLKMDRPSEQTADEYDLCLKECLRCLKPGGYLEYFVFDSDIVHGGQLGMTMSVEFGFNLKTRGYDSTPTRSWVGRLKNNGFGTIRRAWIFLPMGTPRTGAYLPALPSTRPEAESDTLGSTANAATITGLLGSWIWEKWMLKLQHEMGKDEDRLLDGVGAALEEGKNTGGGWRCLTGWARKPIPRR